MPERSPILAMSSGRMVAPLPASQEVVAKHLGTSGQWPENTQITLRG
jgi:hypothetical protein